MRNPEPISDFMAGTEDFDPETGDYPPSGRTAAPAWVRGPEPATAPSPRRGGQSGRSARLATPGANAPTDKQAAFILRLLTDLGASEPEAAAAALLAAPGFNRRKASEAIDGLLAANKAKRAMPAPAAAPAAPAADLTGMHGLDGRIYKVQTSRTSGRAYAKELTDEGFVYAPGAMRRLTSATRLSLEEAAAYGQRTGTCCCCGRTLTVAASIEAGIGPVCASRGWGA